MAGTNVKFGRNYVLQATSPRFSPPLQIGLPFTLEIEIERNSYSSSNHAVIKLYNLSTYHRNLLLHDQNDPSLFTAINVVLSAGYGDGPYFPVVFKGNTTRAYSVRQGVTWITTLECFDGGTSYANATTNGINTLNNVCTFAAGRAMADVYTVLINQLKPYGVTRGAVSQAITAGTLAKGTCYSGNVMEILKDLSNTNVFVDNLKLNILAPNEVIQNQPLTLNASSGLLGTPIKENQWLSLEMLFEPRVIIGSVINLNSITAVNVYNGPHKVVSVRHRGMISPAVSGDLITSLGLEAGIFNTVLSSSGL